eukprot:gene1937-22099_t
MAIVHFGVWSTVLLFGHVSGGDAPWQKIKLRKGSYGQQPQIRGQVFVQKPEGELLGHVGVASYHFGCALMPWSDANGEELHHSRYMDDGVHEAESTHLEGWIDYSQAPRHWTMSNGQ